MYASYKCNAHMCVKQAWQIESWGWELLPSWQSQRRSVTPAQTPNGYWNCINHSHSRSLNTAQQSRILMLNNTNSLVAKYFGTDPLRHGPTTVFMAKGHTCYCELVHGATCGQITGSGIPKWLNHCEIFCIHTIYKCGHGLRYMTWLWVPEPNF
jgi:hypothetical protein